MMLRFRAIWHISRIKYFTLLKYFDGSRWCLQCYILWLGTEKYQYHIIQCYLTCTEAIMFLISSGPVKQSWKILVNKSQKSTMIYDITTSKGVYRFDLLQWQDAVQWYSLLTMTTSTCCYSHYAVRWWADNSINQGRHDFSLVCREYARIITKMMDVFHGMWSTNR